MEMWFSLPNHQRVVTLVGFTPQNTWRKFGLVSKDEDSVVVSADKIGIGTTNPSQELDVHGSVNITGVLTATSYGNVNALELLQEQSSLVMVLD